jgi:hypothetical protein
VGAGVDQVVADAGTDMELADADITLYICAAPVSCSRMSTYAFSYKK